MTLCVSACALIPSDAEDTGADELIRSSYKAADVLSMAATERWKQPIRKDSPVLVATLVNIDSLEASSRLGRLISEQLQARFSQLGYSVIEAKLRGNLFVKQDAGELLLSRELKDISTTHHARVVVVGTYAAARDKVFVNLKMVGDDNVVIGSHDYALAQDNNVRALLMNR